MKTKEEKLRAVTEDIRSKLPRLKELEKGCLLKYNDDFIEICKKMPKTSKFNDNFYQGFSHDDICGHWFYENQIEDLGYEIIGKEPMLNDVLEWFNKKEFKTELTGQGLLYAVIGKDHPMKKAISCRVDLSKPYLHQQSEELITFLYELL